LILPVWNLAGLSIAFSSEVDTGSHEESPSNARMETLIRHGAIADAKHRPSKDGYLLPPEREKEKITTKSIQHYAAAFGKL
jgi:hypothetical protein